MALAVTVHAYFSHLMFAKHLALFYMYSKQRFKADIMINKWMLPVAYLSICTSTHVPKKKKQLIQNRALIRPRLGSEGIKPRVWYFFVVVCPSTRCIRW